MAARQEPALVPDPSLRAEIDRLVRSVVVGPRRRSAPREDGEELDLDRAVAASAARLTGQTPDLRLYRDRAATGRDLATLVILDISQSTAAATRSGATILDAQRIAVAALADALAASGDRFALRAFASAGRDDIRLTRLKDFDEPHGPAVHERLAALKPGLFHSPRRRAAPCRRRTRAAADRSKAPAGCSPTANHPISTSPTRPN